MLDWIGLDWIGLARYDFSVYGYFSDVIGRNFFPTKNKSDNLGISFLVFGAAFFARPIGSLFLGKVADRYGSKTSIEISIMMMGIGSFLIGCLPSWIGLDWIGKV